MASEKTGTESETSFSFAVRELRQANVAQKLSLPQRLGLDAAPLKAVNENRGFDPYNTSGSFDRTKNWSRVSKR